MDAIESWNNLESSWGHLALVENRFYQIGPFIVQLSFKSASLPPILTQAFAHLEIKSAQSIDLTVRLWDTKETSQPIPFLPWAKLVERGYQGYRENDLYFHYFETLEACSIFHRQENIAYYIIRDHKELPWWISGAPLQIILHLWLREKGMHLTHTAAISNGKTAVLLSGKGGSGKSTTSLACVAEGLYYLSEDYCILNPTPTPSALSIYQSAKWRKQTRTLFPQYEHLIVNPKTADQEKALLYYEDLFPTQIQKQAPVTSVISLRIGHGPEPVLQSQTPTATISDLLLSTVKQLPFYQPQTIEIFQQFVKNTEHYQLILCQNMKKNVEIIRKILCTSI